MNKRRGAHGKKKSVISLAYLKNEMEINPEELTERLTSFISEKMAEFKRNGVIFGLSGRLDSSVLAELCVRAVGKENTMALMMPEKDSYKEHLRDAELLESILSEADITKENISYIRSLIKQSEHMRNVYVPK